MMITGDYHHTAIAVAKDVGMVKANCGHRHHTAAGAATRKLTYEFTVCRQSSSAQQHRAPLGCQPSSDTWWYKPVLR